MATNADHRQSQHNPFSPPPKETARPARGPSFGSNPLYWPMRGLASLKLTQVLLVLAIALIVFGTLAQATAGMWDVISRYFTAWFVFIPLREVLPKTWFPVWHEQVSPNAGFPFLGGASIGLAMIVNLLSAHLWRFRVQVRGPRLMAGVAVLAAGCVLTWLVVKLGDYQQGLRAEPIISWESTAVLTLMGAVAAALGLMSVGFWYAFTAYQTRSHQLWVRSGLAVAGSVLALVGCLLLAIFFKDIAALRILWQLIQGTVAGVVLLGGCWLLFDRRAGIVLLHGGVGLLMIGQLFVALWAVEQRMSIDEGATAAHAIDIRVAELAVVRASDEEETHTVVPHGLIERAAAAKQPQGQVISHADLPFDLHVVKFLPNSAIADVDEHPDAKNLANAGIGRSILAQDRPVGSGASSDSQVDMPSVYIDLRDKSTQQSLGVYMLSTMLNEDSVRVGNQSYRLVLRFKHEFKPYQITLHDVTKEDYPGSNTPRKYESKVQIVDPRHGVDRTVTISMNEPFRYLGETFYQSGYHFDPRTGKESTTLQVVTNSGWMIPYVACMVVAVGMLFQFVQTLMKFVLAESQVAAPAATPSKLPPAHRPAPRSAAPALQPAGSGDNWWKWFAPSPLAYGTIGLTAVVILMGLYWPKPNLPAEKGDEAFDLYAFGELAVISGGRTKPIDSLAREAMLAMSNRASFSTYYEAASGSEQTPLLKAGEVDAAQQAGRKVKSRSHTAVQWLLDTVARPEMAEHYQVIRLEHKELRDSLGLSDQRKSMRYSMSEFRTPEVADRYDTLMSQVREKKERGQDLDSVETKLLELDGRLQSQLRIAAAFTPRELPDLPEREADDPQVMNDAIQLLRSVTRFHGMMQQIKPPLAVPITNANAEKIFEGEKWLPFSVAVMFADARTKIAAAGIFRGEDAEIDKPTLMLNNIFTAYAQGDAAKFNSNVKVYAEWLDRNQPPIDSAGATYEASKVEREAYFNHVGPFGWSQGMLLYLLAFVVSAFGLMAFRRQLGSAAFWMLLIIFAYHTIALATRMYISGRPPVTNLYSSAVFIAWVGVLIGLVLEGAFRIGVGNVVASICGFMGLLIAYMLSFDGDTIGVEQAVLDTQFWLSTHVVTITVGYGATYFAGLLGVLYILLGLFTPAIDKQTGKLLARMIYGMVCFALLFSFVGTVLGGLWADDSWGRFWGWDPKENGALIIVLWNAFILHAKWDKMANERGLAALAVVGIMVTSWSWFGTNLLGVGLHSYGFSKTIGVALIATFVVSGGIFFLGLLPKSVWVSFRRRQLQEPREAQVV
jgi:ABC-type transport system involved in cytochrome c biogenesis permease subunit